MLFEKHFSVRVTTHDLGKCIVDYFLSCASQVYSINFLGQENMLLHAISKDKVHVVRVGVEDSFLEVWLSTGKLVALVAADSTFSILSSLRL